MSRQEVSPRCPECRGRSVGRVGTSQYYCWDCCVEFANDGKEVEIYQVERDGSLVTIRRERNGRTVKTHR